MANQPVSVSESSDQTLLRIVHKLPPERVAQVIDFARFLETQTRTADPDVSEESEDEIAASNVRWDALLASDDAQSLLEQMADEALAAINAGHATPIRFTDDDEIAPG
jgi:hypothetical protein